MKRLILTILTVAVVSNVFAIEDKIQIQNNTNYEIPIRVSVSSPKNTHDVFVNEVTATPGFTEHDPRKNYTKNDYIKVEILNKDIKGMIKGSVQWNGEDVYITFENAIVTLLKVKENGKWTTSKITADEASTYEVLKVQEMNGYCHYELSTDKQRAKIMTNDQITINKLNEQL